MSFISLSFLNKNQYRRYPIKQDSSAIADNGLILDDTLIVACNITSTYGKHRLYIRQIYKKDTFISLAVASVFTDEVLGAFTGNISSDFTTLNFTSFTNYISGSITIGSVEAFRKIPATLHFDKTATELEESTIFCYTPPAVTSIKDKKNTKLVGDVKFGTLTNITKTTHTGTTLLSVKNPASVFNKIDKSTLLDNCPNPIIKNINGVKPSPIGGPNNPYPANDGNIYIVGVNPIVFFGTDTPNTKGTIKVETENLTLSSLCVQKHKLLPPVEICGFTNPTQPDTYYNKPSLGPVDVDVCDSARPQRLAGSYYESVRPEYYFWPQFVKEEYYTSYWKTP